VAGGPPYLKRIAWAANAGQKAGFYFQQLQIDNKKF
jgi:hypothetical protein